MFKGLPARAIHLGFALLLAFLIFPYSRGKKISAIDILISIIAAFSCLYIYFFYDQLVDRGGILLKINLTENLTIPVELIISICGILILLEATKKSDWNSISYHSNLLFIIFHILGNMLPK